MRRASAWSFGAAGGFMRSGSYRTRKTVRVPPVKRWLYPLGLFVAWVFAGGAHAHEAGTSYLHVVAPRADAEITLRWELALHDVITSIFIDQDFDGVVGAQELQAARDQVSAAVRSQISLQRGEAVCEVRVGEPALSR